MSRKDKIIQVQAEESKKLWEENQRLRDMCELKDDFYKEMIADGLRHGSSLAGKQMAYRKDYLKEQNEKVFGEHIAEIDDESYDNNDIDNNEVILTIIGGTIVAGVMLFPKAKAFYIEKVKPKALDIWNGIVSHTSD